MKKQDLVIALLEQLPIGVIGMTSDSEVLLYNSYEEQLAGRPRDSVLGKRFFKEVAPCTRVAELEQRYLDGIRSRELSYTLDFRFPRPFLDRPRDVRLHLLCLEDAEPMAGLLLVEDISAIRAIERTKDFLVRTLAHDMSSPLGAAQLALELLKTAEDEEASDLLRSSERSLKKLREMVQNLYEVTRLQTTDVPLRYETANIWALLEDLVEERRSRASRSGLRLSCELGEVAESTEAVVDHQLVRRAVANLLDNALAYTPPGGQVVARLEVPGSHLVIDVADSGPGIPEDRREEIFRPFERGDQPSSSNGSDAHRGLGLAVVELVAREHGGLVKVLDTPYGGALLRLMLPREPPAS